MSHTKHTDEAKHEGKATTGRKAEQASRDSRRATAIRGGARRSSSHVPSDARAAGAARSLRKGRADDDELLVELTIDWNDDRVVEAVARFLLGITAHKHRKKT